MPGKKPPCDSRWTVAAAWSMINGRNNAWRGPGGRSPREKTGSAEKRGTEEASSVPFALPSHLHDMPQRVIARRNTGIAMASIMAPNATRMATSGRMSPMPAPRIITLRMAVTA